MNGNSKDENQIREEEEQTEETDEDEEENCPADRVINLVVGCIAGLLFVITFISSFFAHRPPHGLNIYFGICICIILVSHIVLIYWYRKGDLDPKFRLLIYYNAFGMIALTTCALAYFFVEDKISNN